MENKINPVKEYNTLCNNQSLTERFKLWENYRAANAKWIEETCGKVPQNSCVAVLGAGNCDDIDLEKLSNIYSEIYLFDIDSKALDRGTQKYNINQNCKIIKVGDINFINFAQINFFEDMMDIVGSTDTSDSTKFKRLKKYFIKKGSEIKPCSDMSVYYKKFDTVISSAVYTQIGRVVLSSCKLDSYIKNEKILKDLIKEYMYIENKIYDAYNNLLLDLVKDGGNVILFTDYAEFTRDNPNSTTGLANVHKAMCSGDYSKVEESCFGFKIGNATQGISNLLNKVNGYVNIPTTLRITHFPWGFSTDKVYIVKYIYIKKVF
ncbi:MAG: hypothetical protein E7231_00500 [Cellulosilyticum sp.]|nr:hypothetical protein [Cellulosilyticum sp.]